MYVYSPINKMDEFVKNKLREWNLAEQLLPIFEENFIDDEAFKLLNVDVITSLIPKVGLRLRFLKHWEQEFKHTIKEANPDQSAIILSDEPLQVIDIADLGNILEQSEIGNTANGVSASSSTISEEKSISRSDKESLITTDNKTEFLSMLKQSVKRIGVARKHALGHKFEQDTRLALAEAVISVEILKHPDYKIPTTRLNELAELIEITFPPEKADTYYIPYKLNEITKQKILAKGKLYDKYCAYRLFLRNTGVLPPHKKRKQVGKPVILGYRENLRSIEESEDIIVKVNWLKNSLEPWTTVEKYWQETAKPRIGLLTSSAEAITSHEYITTFKALQQPLGLNLVKIDFAIVHSEKTLSFFARWPEFQQKLIKYCWSRKKNDSSIKAILELLPENIFNDESDEDSFRFTSDNLAVVALRLLPLLLPCPYIKVGKKPAWRPTKAEIQNEFVLHVTSISEVETELAIRERKLSKYGLTEQPIVIVVGEDLLATHHHFICINTVKYRADSILAAIDATFQSFFALQLEYPRAAELPWLVLQKQIYEIQDESARNIPSVTTLINDLTRT